jgi:hypothetical protein
MSSVCVWGTAIEVANQPGATTGNVMAAQDPSGNLWIIWTTGGGEGYFQKYTLSTKTWSSATRFDNPGGIPAANNGTHRIAVDDSGRAMVTWFTGAGANQGLYGRRILSNLTMETEQLIGSGVLTEPPDICFKASGNFSIIRRGSSSTNTLKVADYNSTSNLWENDRTVWTPVSPIDSRNPNIAYSTVNSTLYFAWQEQDATPVFKPRIAYLKEGGTKETVTSVATTVQSTIPRLAMDRKAADVAYIVYRREIDPSGARCILQIRSGSWGAEQNIDANADNGNTPYCVVDMTNNLHIVYGDSSLGAVSEIYYRRRLNGGYLETKKRLSNAALSSSACVLPFVQNETANLTAFWIDVESTFTHVWMNECAGCVSADPYRNTDALVYDINAGHWTHLANQPVSCISVWTGGSDLQETFIGTSGDTGFVYQLQGPNESTVGIDDTQEAGVDLDIDCYAVSQATDFGAPPFNKTMLWLVVETKASVAAHDTFLIGGTDGTTFASGPSISSIFPYRKTRFDSSYVTGVTRIISFKFLHSGSSLSPANQELIGFSIGYRVRELPTDSKQGA